MPFNDDNGTVVSDTQSWNRSRNQQRNWETINQLIALRTLPEDISVPQRQGDTWTFSFCIPGTSSALDIDLQSLLDDCDGVPMITGLDEQPDIEGILITKGSKANIWFAPAMDK
jgi:hypothetical protein